MLKEERYLVPHCKRLPIIRSMLLQPFHYYKLNSNKTPHQITKKIFIQFTLVIDAVFCNCLFNYMLVL